jgi:hypothetical protein
MDREALVSEGFGKLLNCWRSRRDSSPCGTAKGRCLCRLKIEMAGATGLKPAASCVTGKRSNQLSCDPASEVSLTLRIFQYVRVSCIYIFSNY